MTLLSVLLAYYSVYIDKHATDIELQNRLTVKVVKDGLYLCSYLVVFIPGALRYFVGIDYSTYTYQQIPMVLSGINVKIEPLYKLVIYVGNWLGNGFTYQPIFVITNFLIVTILFFYIRQQSSNIPLSIFIFMAGGFFAFSLSGMRQSIGIVIALYSLKYIKQQKLLRYITGIVIAGFFHTSALIFLPIYFIHKIRINPFVIFMIMILIRGYAEHIRAFFMYASGKLGIYSNYFGGAFDNGQYSRLQVYLVLSIMMFLCLNRVLLGKERFYRNNDEISIHYIACLIVSMISFLPTPSRLLFLFIPVYITLVPNMISLHENRKYKLAMYLGIILVFMFFMYRNIYVQNAYDILPYKSVLGN